MIEDIRWSHHYNDYIISTVDGKQFRLTDMNLETLDELIQKFVLKNDMIVVRSSDRISSLQNPSSYSVTLPVGYFKKNIVDVQLHSCSFPNTVYNVTENNNIFKIGFGADPAEYSSFALPERNYTTEDLCTMISSLVQSEETGNGFSVKVSTSKGKLVFLNENGEFVLDLSDTNSCHKILGFEQKSYSSTSGKLVGEKCFDLQGPKLFSVCIKQLGHIFHDSVLQPVLRNSLVRNVTYESTTTDEPRIHFRRIERLSSLSIEIRDEHNTLVDFRGAEHVLVLKLTYLDIQ